MIATLLTKLSTSLKENDVNEMKSWSSLLIREKVFVIFLSQGERLALTWTCNLQQPNAICRFALTSNMFLRAKEEQSFTVRHNTSYKNYSRTPRKDYWILVFLSTWSLRIFTRGLSHAESRRELNLGGTWLYVGVCN